MDKTEFQEFLRFKRTLAIRMAEGNSIEKKTAELTDLTKRIEKVEYILLLDTCSSHWYTVSCLRCDDETFSTDENVAYVLMLRC